MAQTPFTKTILPLINATTGVALTLAACDATNGNSIVCTGTEMCVVINSDTSSAHTFTITGQPDPQGRTANFSMSVAQSGSITALSAIITPILSTTLWATGGLILLPSSNSASLYVGVVTNLP